jgi:hypothetical protein
MNNLPVVVYKLQLLYTRGKDSERRIDLLCRTKEMKQIESEYDLFCFGAIHIGMMC